MVLYHNPLHLYHCSFQRLACDAMKVTIMSPVAFWRHFKILMQDFFSFQKFQKTRHKEREGPHHKNTMAKILLFLLTVPASHAQFPSSVPTSVATSWRPSLAQSESPSIAPSITTNPTKTKTLQPTISESLIPPFTLSPTREYCSNEPTFYVEFWDYYNCTWNFIHLTCDDDRVSCYDYGNHGPAVNYCCKCKYLCSNQCNDPVYTAPPPDDDYSNCYDPYNNYDDEYDDGSGMNPLIIVFLFFCGGSICARVIYNCQGERPARRAVQQTMSERRQQQRENNTQGLTEGERQNERYELFVTKFYFQTVLPDKSNITANSLRNLASSKPDEEHPSNKTTDDDDASSAVGGRQSSSLSDRLSTWRRPSDKDECCICLECYSEGETICAAMTKECNHVFHEGCILEWLKTKDRCPLCRVELLKD